MDIFTRLDQIPQEINQIDNEKLQLQQRLDGTYAPVKSKFYRTAYASSPESNTPSGNKEEGAYRRTARAHCEGYHPRSPGKLEESVDSF